MRLPILLIALVSTTLAQRNAQRSARTPQAQIRYQDPTGLKVDWKLFSRQTQSHLRSLQQSQQEQPAASAHLGQSSHPQQQQQAHPQQQLQRQDHQSELIRIRPEEVPYKSYLQPEPQAPEHPDHTQAQYNAYAQHQVQPTPQPDHGQEQYVQQQIPIEAQVNLNQIQYKTFAPPQSQPEDHSGPVQVQYKAYPHPQLQAEAQPELNQIHYNAYQHVPSHAKQVVLENHKPQGPYAEQSRVHYASNVVVPQEQRSANGELPQYEQIEQQKSRRDYPNNGLQGKIVYKDEYEQQPQQQQEQYQQQEQQEQYQQQLHEQYQQQQQEQYQQQQPEQYQQQQQEQYQQQQQEQYQQQQLDHVQVPVEKLPVPPPQKLVFHKDMPREIQQLLQFQAELPYNVIANTINYKPKTLFVPKPLPPETKGPYNYRSKIYYLNNDHYEPDFERTKPVEEEQS